MGNLGGGEILVILLVALVVLGPTKLPTAARQAGRAIAELKRLSAGFQREMQAAMDEVSSSGEGNDDTDAEADEAEQQAAAEEAERRARSRRLVTGSDRPTDLGVRNGDVGAADGDPGSAAPSVDVPAEADDPT